jgi:hypothetical protein
MLAYKKERAEVEAIELKKNFKKWVIKGTGILTLKIYKNEEQNM